jgi:hypothetical protein
MPKQEGLLIFSAADKNQRRITISMASAGSPLHAATFGAPLTQKHYVPRPAVMLLSPEIFLISGVVE